jgi:energy-coupling factor transporter ATP-binding protein EcfA2
VVVSHLGQLIACAKSQNIPINLLVQADKSLKRFAPLITLDGSASSSSTSTSASSTPAAPTPTELFERDIYVWLNKNLLNQPLAFPVMVSKIMALVGMSDVVDTTTINLPSVVLCVGESGTGKSTVVPALDQILNASPFSTDTPFHRDAGAHSSSSRLKIVCSDRDPKMVQSIGIFFGALHKLALEKKNPKVATVHFEEIRSRKVDFFTSLIVFFENGLVPDPISKGKLIGVPAGTQLMVVMTTSVFPCDAHLVGPKQRNCVNEMTKAEKNKLQQKVKASIVQKVFGGNPDWNQRIQETIIFLSLSKKDKLNAVNTLLAEALKRHSDAHDIILHADNTVAMYLLTLEMRAIFNTIRDKIAILFANRRCSPGTEYTISVRNTVLKNGCIEWADRFSLELGHRVSDMEIDSVSYSHIILSHQ